MLDTKVHHKGELSGLIKHIPFIGEVPRIGGEQNERIELNDRTPLAESFRILRTNLAYLFQNKDKDRGEIIFVTSTIKGEGKTFVSYNMARTLASTGKKVLLIGADIRNPKLHRYGEISDAAPKGLSDYLYDFEVTENEVISIEKQAGIKVDMVLSGPIPPNPAELLMNDRLESLLEYAEKSLEFNVYITLLSYCSCIIGNSSSGIREACLFGIPSITIGSTPDLKVYVKKALACLQEYNLLTNICKSKFHIKKIKFLRFFIIIKGIKINLTVIKCICN